MPKALVEAAKKAAEEAAWIKSNVLNTSGKSGSDGSGGRSQGGRSQGWRSQGWREARQDRGEGEQAAG